ncbi:MAG: type II secretion system F family protein [Desulfobacteraceae bacterium]|nr:type II secretion system F family protein [Desulfobacteraceae bacterium]
MPTYKYRARDKFGKAINGVVDASGYEMAAGHLDGLGYTPVSINEKKKDIIPLDFLQGRRGISLEDLILFSRQLSTMFSAGIPLLRSLDALSEQTENKRMKEITDTIRNDIQGGSSLSDALSRHPKVFSELYVSMIHAGETAGTLDEILDHLATLNEHEKDTRARIKVATRYPKIVVIAISLAFIILVSFVVPRFAAMFSRFEATLPLPTRIMIGISHVFRDYWFVMIIVASLIALGFRWYTNTKSGRLRWDGLMLRIPVFGPLFLKITMSRFTHILGMLIRSGIPILDSLKITSATTGNVLISQEVEKLRENVREGGGLSQQLRQSAVFTPMVVQMISAGEESGKMDEMLAKVSQYYELESEYTIKNLSTLIEPVLIITIGGMVLFLALGIFLPMWDMARVVMQ